MRENSELDNQLAEFTDRLLSGETPDKVEPVGDNQELLQAQQMVVQMKRALGSSKPDQAMAERIRSRLLAYWKFVAGKAEPAPKTFRESLQDWLGSAGWKSIFTQRRGKFIGLATVLAVFLILAFYYSPSTGGHLPGMAGGSPLGWPILVVLGVVVCIGAAVYLWRKR